MTPPIRRFASRAPLSLTLSLALAAAAPAARAQEAATPAADPDLPDPLPVAALARAEKVDFATEIYPVLKQNCLACHNATKSKSGLNLETPISIQKGGDNGPAVVPKKPDESLLFLLAAHRDEPVMPPEKNKVNAAPLTPEQLGLLKLWIEEGATGEPPLRTPAKLAWQPLPGRVQPIYAVALSPDGRFAAAGRGNVATVYEVPGRRASGVLADPAADGATHRDLVQSLAFGPGGLLATGGFRTAKLWRRPENVVKAIFGDAAGPVTALAVDPAGIRAAAGAENGPIVIWHLDGSAPPKTLSGHGGVVRGLSFSPDGALLLSGSHDKTVRLWSIPDGAARAQWSAPAPVHDVALVDGGSRAAAAAADGSLRFWAVPAAGAEPAADPVAEAKPSGAALHALAAFGEGQKQLLIGGEDGRLRHWEVAGNKQVREINHGAPVIAVAATSDGQRFASAGNTKRVKLWKADNGEAVADLVTSAFDQVAVGHAERTLAATKRLHDAKKKRRDEAAKRAEKEAEAVVKAAPEREKKKAAYLRLAAAARSAEAAARAGEREVARTAQWAKTSGEAQAALAAALKEAPEKKKAAEAALADASTRMAAAAAAAAEAGTQKGDAAQLVAKVASARENLNRAREAVAAAAAGDPDDATLKDLIASVDAALVSLQARGASAQEKLAAAEKTFAEASAAAAKAGADKTAAEAALAAADVVLKDGAQRKAALDHAHSLATAQSKVATGAAEKAREEADKKQGEADAAKRAFDGAVHNEELALRLSRSAAEALLEAEAAAAAAEAAAAEVNADLEAAKKVVAEGEKAFKTVAFSRGGGLLATGTEDGRALTWDTASGAPLDVVTVPGGAVTGIAFTGPSTFLTGTVGKSLAWWEGAPSWELVRSFGAVDKPGEIIDRVTALGFSPDGTLLATGGGYPSRTGELKVWDVRSGDLVREFKDPHSDTLTDLAFSPDGEHIATASTDRFVKVFRLRDGELVRTFEGHTHHVLGVAWRADGLALASAGADNTVKLWDFDQAKQTKSIKDFGKEVTAVAYVTTGDEFVAAAADPQLRVGNTRYGGLADFLYAAAISPDGKVLVAGGQDGVLRLWKVGDTNPVHRFEPPPVAE